MEDYSPKDEKGEPLTRRQHFVPRVYLRGWTPVRWGIRDPSRAQSRIWAHNLETKTAFPTNPNGVLAQNWFYEKQDDAPDNELEGFFRPHEEAYGKTMAFLDCTFDDAVKFGEGDPRAVRHYLEHSFSGSLTHLEHHRQVLKQFAALSYLRVPAGIDIKLGELSADPATVDLASKGYSPYEFVTVALESTLQSRFHQMNVMIWMSVDLPLVTCDRPCYDADCDNEWRPLFGYDIGRDNRTIALFPLSSRMAMVLLPAQLQARGRPKIDTLPVTASLMGSEMAKQMNAATIRMAQQFVIAQDQDPEIFAMASSP